jgi:hypothetical protein
VTSPLVRAIVLLSTALWHALAAWHFVVTPARTLARTTRERPVSALAAELFRFLGGLNLACVVLAVGAALSPGAQALAAGALATANLTQLLQDLRVRRLGLARGPMFATILAGDALFTLANALLLAELLSRRSGP